jgi:hypothetical protein
MFFYLKLHSTLQVYPYITENTLRLHYEPNLTLSIGLWRWYISITILLFIILFKLNSIGLSVPHRKHITSPLRAQQVNAIYWLVTMDY